MSIDEDKKSLELFNNQVKKLESEDFVRFITTKRTRIRLHHDNITKTRSVEKYFPSEDAIDSALLKVRLFRDDKDGISFRKISEIYQRLPVPKEVNDEFVKMRDAFNKFLDTESNKIINGKAITHREIFDVILWGDRAHVNRDKEKILKQWFWHPFLESAITQDFTSLIAQFYYIAKRISELNKQVLENIKLKDSS